MNGINIVADTNLLIYLLKGNSRIGEQLEGKQLFISVITEMELLGMNGISQANLKIIKGVVDNCVIVDFNNEIKRMAIELKQKQKIKLPDAIIAATSIFLNFPLFTADKYFSKIPNLDCVIIEI
jgi:predicted nucleic acid-binding protein